MQKRLAEVASEGPQTCIALGCKRPTQSTTGKGLSQTYCKPHIEFKRRHGSTWRKTYSTGEIAPYRGAAQKWLKEHRHNALVSRAIAELDSLIVDFRTSGQR